MDTLRRLAGLIALVAVVSACTSAGSPPSSVTPSSPPASQSPDAPIGTEVPQGGGSDPGLSGGDLIVPKPGQLEPQSVRMDKLTAAVDGRHVVITAAWTSGVEPCYVLDTIIVAKGDKSFTITLREGHGPGDVMCIEIAQLKQTRIDLGDLDPGTYTIADGENGAAPIQVVVA